MFAADLWKCLEMKPFQNTCRKRGAQCCENTELRLRKKRMQPKDVALQWIEAGEDPQGFKIILDPIKGRGIVTTMPRKAGDFLLQYCGEIITGEEGERREDELSPGFRFFFGSKRKQCSPRSLVGVPQTNPYIFARTTADTPLSGNEELRKVTDSCPNLQYPERINSTALRKYIATVSQILDMTPKEVEMLARQLGHDDKTHKENYRLAHSTQELTAVAQLLLTVERGDVNKWKGKQLCDIEIADLEDDPQDLDQRFESTSESTSCTSDVAVTHGNTASLEQRSESTRCTSDVAVTHEPTFSLITEGKGDLKDYEEVDNQAICQINQKASTNRVSKEVDVGSDNCVPECLTKYIESGPAITKDVITACTTKEKDVELGNNLSGYQIKHNVCLIAIDLLRRLPSRKVRSEQFLDAPPPHHLCESFYKPQKKQKKKQWSRSTEDFLRKTFKVYLKGKNATLHNSDMINAQETCAELSTRTLPQIRSKLNNMKLGKSK